MKLTEKLLQAWRSAETAADRARLTAEAADEAAIAAKDVLDDALTLQTSSEDAAHQAEVAFHDEVDNVLGKP